MRKNPGLHIGIDSPNLYKALGLTFPVGYVQGPVTSGSSNKPVAKPVAKPAPAAAPAPAPAAAAPAPAPAATSTKKSKTAAAAPTADAPTTTDSK